MTDKEKLTKIRAELERVMEWEKEQAAHTYGNLCQLHECRADMCDKFLSFIDYTQEKSINNGLDLGCGVIWKDVEPVSEDLEEAIGEYCSNPDNFISYVDTGFAYRSEQKDDIPLIIKAIRFGANWQKQQMMKKAISGHVGQTINGMLRALSDETFGDMGFTAGDKVKLIIIKAD